MLNQLELHAKFFKGFADPTRLSIILSLLDTELTVSEIVSATNLSQSNASNHLKCLLGCGLVSSRREGKNIYYSLRDSSTKDLLSLSNTLVKDVASEIEACHEDEHLESSHV